MYSMETIASSGLTITLTPGQAFVGASLLGLVLLSNAKSLLFIWHGRLFSQLARHFLFGRSQLTVKSAKHGGEALFAPVITSSYTPLLDIDYNLHKSNSTFFNDLDDNRTELMLALFKDAIKPVKHGKDTPNSKMFNLGATSCIFKKPIAPFARYEISSRLLCWDKKWIYVVSHFTKPGSNIPTRFLLGSQASKGHRGVSNESQQDRIYATAITKYVFKAGRVTCAPEAVLLECDLLPPPPANEGVQGLKNGISHVKKDAQMSWEEVQAECKRHLEVAQNFGSLDALHDTFVGRSGPAIYTY